LSLAPANPGLQEDPGLGGGRPGGGGGGGGEGGEGRGEPSHVILGEPVIAAPLPPATLTHPAIIGLDKRANHQHGPDKHYSQMTAHRSVLATV